MGIHANSSNLDLTLEEHCLVMNHGFENKWSRALTAMIGVGCLDTGAWLG